MESQQNLSPPTTTSGGLLSQAFLLLCRIPILSAGHSRYGIFCQLMLFANASQPQRRPDNDG